MATIFEYCGWFEFLTCPKANGCDNMLTYHFDLWLGFCFYDSPGGVLVHKLHCLGSCSIWPQECNKWEKCIQELCCMYNQSVWVLWGCKLWSPCCCCGKCSILCLVRVAYSWGFVFFIIITVIIGLHYIPDILAFHEVIFNYSCLVYSYGVLISRWHCILVAWFPECLCVGWKSVVPFQRNSLAQSQKFWSERWRDTPAGSTSPRYSLSHLITNKVMEILIS